MKQMFLYSIDACEEDSSLGRLVDDEHRRPNCKMKTIEVNEKPHLCLFAIRDITAGEELTYNYGDSNWAWRAQVSYLFISISNMPPTWRRVYISCNLLQTLQTRKR